MFASEFEKQWWQIDLQELLQFFFVVGNAQNTEIDLIDQVEFPLLSGGVRHFRAGSIPNCANALCGMTGRALRKK